MLSLDKLHLNKRKLVFTVLVLIAGVLLVLRNLNQRNLPQTLESLLRKCSQTTKVTANSLDYTCLKNGLRPIVNAKSLSVLINSLEAVFSKEEGNHPFGTLTCHGPAHALGEVATSKAIALAEVFDSCDRNCDYGCLHGAFVQMARQTPTFAENFTSVCDQFKNTSIDKDLVSCYHITGHGLMDVLNRDTVRVVGECDKFTDEMGRISCSQGAIMEDLLGTAEGSIPFDTESQDIVQYCRKITGKYSFLCYEMVGFYGYTLMNNKDDAAKACTRVPEENRNSCFLNLGARAYFAYRASPADIRNYCSKQSAFRLPCILGAVEVDIDFDPEFKNATDICLGEKEFSKECFSKLGDHIEYAYGRKRREDFCSSLDESSAPLCLTEDAYKN